MGPNIKSLPEFEPLPDLLSGPVLLKVGNNVSTDDIMPAGAQILPFRSNIPKISKFVYGRLDENFYERSMPYRASGFVWVGGDNYGQGSSREHAALAPRYLGLRAVIAKSFARIHRQNLINFGILPLTFLESSDYETVEQGDEIEIPDLRHCLLSAKPIYMANKTKDETYDTEHHLNRRQVDILLAGSLMNVVKKRTGTGLIQ